MIINSKEIEKLSTDLKKNGKKIIFTNGCFDILHSGHVTYLNKSKELGDVLIVGLNSDNSVRRLKGASRPINNEIDRAYILDNLKSVDYVSIFDEDTPLELIKKVLPDIITKGGDYKKENVVGYSVVKEYGGDVVIIDLVEGKSTTDIIKRIEK
jgi:glycerol-3-phosphate cytidylyltransferase